MMTIPRRLDASSFDREVFCRPSCVRREASIMPTVDGWAVRNRPCRCRRALQSWPVGRCWSRAQSSEKTMTWSWRLMTSYV